MYLLAVDPSIRCSGVALFADGVLVDAAALRHAGTGHVCVRAVEAGNEIADWYLNRNGFGPVHTVAVEWPKIYAPGKSGGSRNDQVPMAGVSASVCAILSPRHMLAYYPSDWAGQLPKATTKRDVMRSPRARRILSRLAPGESARVPQSHDALDAIGIGLHALGRLDPNRVFAGATSDG